MTGDLDRRQFIRASAGVAAASGVVCTSGVAVGAGSDGPAIPPHAPVDLPGVHAYAQKSLAAGQTLDLRVSSSVPYDVSICRLGREIDDLASDTVLHTFASSDPTPQPIHPGSYVHIDHGLPSGADLRELTLECWVRPWRPTGTQAIISLFNSPDACGFVLAIEGGPRESRVIFYLGDGGVERKENHHHVAVTSARRWMHLVAVWDGKTKSIWVDGVLAGRWEVDGLRPRGADAPLRLGALAIDSRVTRSLDGDLAMPAIYGRALSDREISSRFKTMALAAPVAQELLGCWPLSEERGDRVADISIHGRHGRIINHGTWMIGGPSFDGSAVWQYDRSYDPSKDPTRGHGLRFATDDLFDCRWRTTHQWAVPPDARSGLYVARIRYELKGKPHLYDVTFIVRKHPARAPAPLLVLCSTNTWLAYSSTAFAVNGPARRHWSTKGVPSLPGAPAYSFYRNHHHPDGQPTYYVGLAMPWPAAGPHVMYGDPRKGYSHLMRIERFTHAWLDENGYAYDLVCDEDLDRDPDLLRNYKALLINGHSEYWSARAAEGVDRYLSGGGRVMVLSGNTMCWRVSFDPDYRVMECRKFDARMGGRPGATVGELWHSHDGQRGSLLRETEFPAAWQVLGTESIGHVTENPDVFGVYRVEQPEHFLFQTPHEVGLGPGESFGEGDDAGLRRAVGHEGDVRLPSIEAMTDAPPPSAPPGAPGAAVPPEPEGIVTLARSIAPPQNTGAKFLDYFARPMDPKGDRRVIGEMIYWERPRGGTVFHAGAIAVGWTLSADPKLAALNHNVLHHFGVPRVPEPD